MANSFVVDSGNVYTLYVDQGTEFNFTVPFSAFGIIGTIAPSALSSSPTDTLAADSILDTLVTIIEPQVLTSKTFSLDIGNGNTLTSNGVLDSQLDYHADNLTFAGTVRRFATSKSYADFVITKDLINGSIKLTLTPQSTFNLVQPRYNFDVCYKNTNGNVVKAFGGSIIVSSTLTLNI